MAFNCKWCSIPYVHTHSTVCSKHNGLDKSDCGCYLTTKQQKQVIEESKYQISRLEKKILKLKKRIELVKKTQKIK